MKLLIVAVWALFQAPAVPPSPSTAQGVLEYRVGASEQELRTLTPIEVQVVPEEVASLSAQELAKLASEALTRSARYKVLVRSGGSLPEDFSSFRVVTEGGGATARPSPESFAEYMLIADGRASSHTGICEAVATVIRLEFRNGTRAAERIVGGTKLYGIVGGSELISDRRNYDPDDRGQARRRRRTAELCRSWNPSEDGITTEVRGGGGLESEFDGAAATRNGERMLKAVIEQASRTGPLPFSLACDAHDEDDCENAREILKSFRLRDLGFVDAGLCRAGQWRRACYTLGAFERSNNRNPAYMLEIEAEWDEDDQDPDRGQYFRVAKVTLVALPLGSTGPQVDPRYVAWPIR